MNDAAEILAQFILEARECLETIGQRLLQIERDPTHLELLNDLFRSVHTLKGNCGMFEFGALERVVHAGEDVLDRVRAGKLPYTSAMADLLLAAMDHSAEMIDALESTGELPASAEQRSHQLARDLRAFLQDGPTGTASASTAVGGSGSGAASPAASRAASHADAAAVQAIAAAALSAGAYAAAPQPAVPLVPPAPDWVLALPQDWQRPGACVVRYLPEPECFFKGEDPWALVQQAPGLLALQVLPPADWGPADAFDCYQCRLGFLVLCDAPQAYVEEHFRYVPEQCEWHVIQPVATAASGAGAATSNGLAGSDPQGATGSPGASALASGGPSSATANASANGSTNGSAARSANGAPSGAGTGDTATDAGTAPSRTALLLRAAEIWQEQLALLDRPGCSAGTLEAVAQVLSRLLPLLNDAQGAAAVTSMPLTTEGAPALAAWARRVRPEAADTALPSGSAGPVRLSTGDEALAQDRGGHRVLKVAQDKIDRLMDLIGEMVVAKNALPYLAQRAETQFGQREMAREIKNQYAVINRIAEDMQHAIMQVRMLPVGTVFQRFGRLVRDLSKRLGKEVQLVIEGEDTEADKNVIESLADPLIHILRNSLDHGIELPADRVAAGKPAQGTLRVQARQEGDRVILDISDDGAGINTARVRAKAVERGLIPADRADALSEAEAVQLIFLPGFSTTDSISDLSGRGVGMDVVRSAVERINGTVSLSSERGQGTRIRLTLPLSMAVTHVMMIRAAGCRFGVPMDLIVETVRVPAEDIHRFKQAQTVVLRGRVVPLRPLNQMLALEEPPRLNAEGEHAVLVLRWGGEQIGLIVDEFDGTCDIILRPLEGVLGGLAGFAGSALMGDGSVLMILNPKELL
ncbi:chemotaxis protein CheA [Roseateles depolymerans]|uniref:Chemotaxis protein CheA n=1 Tax=Roseateles depolymerans TaxID=76731 RepID=A0A0U3E1B8_9BURK|nr:chemotaxis protein CheA [Roseateles depolymerans]ALV06949.1 hypothetical protein RD2015_2481 [Roseateles depolymerans]REG19929.1 two-component system chemotaxis sensor kinase CheA [Roseateles depolymerans]